MGRKCVAPKGEAFLPGTSAAELSEMGRRADNGTDAYRYMAMSMRKRGMEIKDIAASLDLPHETIRRWITRAHREGLAGVPHRKGGSHARLTVEQRGELFTDILFSRPFEFGHQANAWDDATARDHIEQKFGVVYSHSGAHRLLRRIGLHPMSARPEHPLALGEREQEARARAIRAELRSLRRQGFKVQGGEDECHVQVNERPTRALGASGCGPSTVPSYEPGGTVTLFVAVMEGVLYIMRSKTGGNGREFIRFCDTLLEHNDKVAMLADNASYHKSKLVQAYLLANHSRLRLVYLPPYTPAMAIAEAEMGPIKRAVARRTPESKRDVWPALCAAVERGEVPVSKLFEWMRFADPAAAAAAAGPGQGQRESGYEYDGDLITVRSAPPTEPPRRISFKKEEKNKDAGLSPEEYLKIPKSILKPNGALLDSFNSIPNCIIRNPPAGLVRE